MIYFQCRKAGCKAVRKVRTYLGVKNPSTIYAIAEICLEDYAPKRWQCFLPLGGGLMRDFDFLLCAYLSFVIRLQWAYISFGSTK